MEFREIRNWVYFGNKKTGCPGEVTEEMIEFFKTNKKLPEPCNKCYKGLIFWEGSFTKENLERFKKMINSSNFEIKGKYDEGVIVFYFMNKNEMLKFLKILEQKMKNFDVRGKIQWRRACKKFQERVPEYWLNAKQFIWE